MMITTDDLNFYVLPDKLIGVWPLKKEDIDIIKNQVALGQKGKAKLQINWTEGIEMEQEEMDLYEKIVRAIAIAFAGLGVLVVVLGILKLLGD
jgi:hypothetical protein